MLRGMWYDDRYGLYVVDGLLKASSCTVLSWVDDLGTLMSLAAAMGS